MKIKILLLFLIVGCRLICNANSVVSNPHHTSSQSTELSGIVTDSLGTPLAGVSVVLKGTINTGTQTDINGRYILVIPDSEEREQTLVFSLVGYASVEAPIGENRVIDIILTEDSSEIDEVVV